MTALETQEAEREAIRLLRVIRKKYAGLLLVSYEDEYRRNDQNLREKIDAVLGVLPESEKE